MYRYNWKIAKYGEGVRSRMYDLFLEQETRKIVLNVCIVNADHADIHETFSIIT